MNQFMSLLKHFSGSCADLTGLLETYNWIRCSAYGHSPFLSEKDGSFSCIFFLQYPASN